MIPLSELSPLRRARAQLIREQLAPGFELSSRNYEFYGKCLGLSREDLDRAIEDCVEADLATLRTHGYWVCVDFHKEADHGNSP